jgi:hypothetical protein
MLLQNEEAIITNGRIILSANTRGMVMDEGCFNGLSYIWSVGIRLQDPIE